MAATEPRSTRSRSARGSRRSRGSAPDGRPYVWADAPGGSQMVDTAIDAIDRADAAGASNTHGAFPV